MLALIHRFRPLTLVVILGALIFANGWLCGMIVQFPVWWLWALYVATAVAIGLVLATILHRLHCSAVAVRAPALRWDRDDLPPPGLAIVRCEGCGRTGVLPAELAAAVSTTRCSQCA